MARVICFLCLSEYRHQPIPALHIPCTAWNITFISMICCIRCCPRLFLHNTCRASDGPAGVWPRTWAGIRYTNVGSVTISDPDCYVAVSVMFWFAHFSVVFYSWDLHKRHKWGNNGVWGLRYVISMYILLLNYPKVKTPGTFNASQWVPALESQWYIEVLWSETIGLCMKFNII